MSYIYVSRELLEIGSSLTLIYEPEEYNMNHDIMNQRIRKKFGEPKE